MLQSAEVREELRVAIQRVLDRRFPPGDPVFANLGVEVTAGTRSESSYESHYTVTVAGAIPEGGVRTAERTALDARAIRLGFGYGAEMLWQGSRWRVVGFRVSAPRYPVILRNVRTSDERRATIEQVQQFIRSARLSEQRAGEARARLERERAATQPEAIMAARPAGAPADWEPSEV
jgi:hypothetical protein